MQKPIFIAMLATHSREGLLLQRAIPSVLSQSVGPDSIVVVDDAAPSDLAEKLIRCSPEILYLANRRTKGLSGALNTGIDHIARQQPDLSSVFVAFLDDDDMWEAAHLENVQKCILRGASVVATPFLRLETGSDPRTIKPPVSRLDVEAFYAGNPGIQGSNLVVRLDLLLKAGMFNEAVSACTDRDLLIRLSRLANLNFQSTSVPTVRHFACTDRLRLSTPGSREKRAGLEMFDMLHGPLMGPECRASHLSRAKRLFDWQPEGVASDNPNTYPETCPFSPLEVPPLIVGIIVDSRRVASASRLLEDLADIAEREDLASLDVVLLQNGLARGPDTSLTEIVSHLRGRLRIRVIDHSALERIARSGECELTHWDAGERLSIADARTVLQAALYHQASERPGSVIWILDDDMRLSPLFRSPNGGTEGELYLRRSLKLMRATGAAICIGSYTGAPPLPPVSSVRVQLVDVMWNLRRLATLPSNAHVPRCEPRNSILRKGRRDYYYDLSRIETDRLETPFALEALHPSETCSEALSRLGEMIPRILAGEAPLRPLLADHDELEAFHAEETFLRGGNTFVFDPEALVDLPNAAPAVKGRATRRSDMIWSLLQVQRCRRRVLSVPVPVRHDRIDLPVPDEINYETIADDIRGYAIFSALKEARQNDFEGIEALCAKFEEERLAALRLSFERISGIAEELTNWCQHEAPGHAPHGTLLAQADLLLKLFSSERFAQIEKAVKQLGPAEVRSFLVSLDNRIASHQSRVREATEIPRILAEERAATARAAVIDSVSPEGEVQILGQGREGVVMSDGETTWKLFDRWSSEQASAAVPILNRMIASGAHWQALVQPRSLEKTTVGWLLEMPFEATEPWQGGHGPGLVELLAELHRSGFACRNLHPKNLRVVGEVVRLVDYGADIVVIDDPTASSLEFQRMCRRAWLTWRWWWRQDLDDLMRRSLTESDMPELSGVSGLINAVRERLGLREISDPTMVRARQLKPARALDYGAGKGKQAVDMARTGSEVVVWDPDPDLDSRLNALGKFGVKCARSASEAISMGPFDLVVCRRVACLLDDDTLLEALADLRAAVSENGRVLLSLCHPSYAHRAKTADGEAISRPCGCTSAPWKKRVRSTGRVLDEFHRSERQLRRLLGRSGLRVTGRWERTCTEFERFEPVSDLLVLELSPIATPNVSLLIKACAMDAEVFQSQVRDIIAALEDPGFFSEIIVAIDNRTSDFVREHTVGDLTALRSDAARLLGEGVVDFVVETPSDSSVLADLNLRWFGLHVDASHSCAGAATGALLAGFEACSTPRVLHVDLDMMIGRTDRSHDPLAELSRALDADFEAITASFPVARGAPTGWTAEGPNGPWRVESRIGLVDLDRMKKALPLPNSLEQGKPRLSWHRALDEAVRQGKGRSLRGGGGQAFCVHPPNSHKSNKEAWAEVRTAVSRGTVSASQFGRIEWSGQLSDWRIAERNESFVFVICGRNVMPERFRRCWNSVQQQARGDWSAIVVDDGSDAWIAEEIGYILAPHSDRVSYVARRTRGGLLANTIHAVRHLCKAPDQVILTLDADDHLIGIDVLDRVANEYTRGADMTVGSMLRTDKDVIYPATFDQPRENRGGNVWQHLRTFKKQLFDSLPDEILRLDGRYIELASDWAFMVPIAEQSQSPVWIKDLLYLHEPGDRREPDRAEKREEVIARLMARKRIEKQN